MKAIIPKGAWLWFWRVHLVIVLALTVHTCVELILEFMAEPQLLPEALGEFALLGLLLTPLVLLFVIAPIVAEVGFLTQRVWNKRSFWMALFAILVILTVVGGAVIALFMSWAVAISPGSLGALDALEAFAFGGQLVALWLYAFRSPHLWQPRASATERSA